MTILIFIGLWFLFFLIFGVLWSGGRLKISREYKLPTPHSASSSAPAPPPTPAIPVATQTSYRWIWWIPVISILAGGGWWVHTSLKSVAPTRASTPLRQPASPIPQQKSPKTVTVTMYAHLQYSKNRQYFLLSQSWGDVIHCIPINSAAAKDILTVCKVGEYCKITCVADDSTGRKCDIGNYGGLRGTLIHSVTRINKITWKDWVNDPERP